MRKLINISVTITTILGMIFSFGIPSHAFAKPIDLRDKLITKTTTIFNQPEKIIIAPIFPPIPDFPTTGEDWYKGIYFYTVERLGFQDIPYHYVVTNLGDAYTGNQSGEEQKLPITNDSNAIVIAYLADRNDTEINPRAFKGLGDLITDVENRNSIKPNKVEIARIDFVKNEKDKVVTMETKEIFGLWKTSLNNLMNQISANYHPIPRTYSVEMSNLVLPNGAVNVGDSPIVRLDIKNTSNFTIYHGTSSELFATALNTNRSKFFVNNLWASQKEATLLEDNTFIRPGETKTVSFRLQVPLYFGLQVEKFAIKNAAGTIFGNTAFDLALNVNHPAQRVVEITKTELGYLRVRQTPSNSAAEIARLGAGERYIILNDLGNGWLQINLGENRLGWISSKYTRNV